MAKQKGKATPHYSDEEKAAIVDQVCELYESQHATIESCCKSAGISDRVFRLWVAQFSDFAERYKKAKARQRNFYWEEVVRPAAETSLVRLLKGETKTETKEEMVGDVVKSRTVTVSRILPNPTAVIFALKGLNPRMFADRHEVTGIDGDPLNTAPQIVIQALNVEPITSEAQLQKLLDQQNESEP